MTLALFEIRDQLAKLRVSRVKRGHLAGMAKRCCDISSACVVGGQFAGLPKQIQRPKIIVLPHQK